MTKMEIPSALASVAKPGTFGNLERGALQGSVFSQIDLVLAKHCPFGGGGRHVRDNHQHGGPHGRARHEPAGPVRATPELLDDDAVFITAI